MQPAGYQVEGDGVASEAIWVNARPISPGDDAVESSRLRFYICVRCSPAPIDFPLQPLD